MRGLAARGHQVTVLSAFGEDKPLKNYRHIQINTGVSIDRKDIMEKFLKEGWSHLGTLRLMLQSIGRIRYSAHFTLNSPEFRKIASEESFDVVFIEIFFNTFLVGIADHFKCPVIALFSAPPTVLIEDLTGNPSTVAAIPHILQGENNDMTFFSRILNFSYSLIEKMIWKIVDWREKSYYNQNFPQPQYRSFDEMKRNISLFFVNDHFSSTAPRPYVPTVIPVGGLYIKSQPDPLSKDLEDFINSADVGIILFTLGSNMKTSFLPPDMLSNLLKVFSNLKQRVVLKWEDQVLTNKPDNVMIKDWLPQSDILGHDKIKLFITHGGLGAIHEAQYHGVPIIGIPLWADQKSNLARAERQGWAKVINFAEFSSVRLQSAIEEVLQDSRYKNAAKYHSSLNRDRPLNALDTAIYWTEYVIRHGGAAHLKYLAADLTYFQRTSIDVLVFLVIALVLLTKLIHTLILLWSNKKKRRQQLCFFYFIDPRVLNQLTVRL
ncbi:hypothetical protein DMENIID0001_011740 [Sergentomyia squamirostris]